MKNTNTQNLTPVTPSEAMVRINKKLEGTGFHMALLTVFIGDERHQARHSVDMFLEDGFVKSFKCLDTLACQMRCLSGDEYLCWPEEAKAA